MVLPNLERLHSDDLSKLVISVLEDNKAQEINMINVTGKSVLADYFCIASATSTRHIQSLADKLCEALKPHCAQGVTVHGIQSANWVIIDTRQVIVHLFQPEARTRYNLMELWQSGTGVQSI